MGRMRPMVDARRLRMMLVALALLGAVATPGAHAAAGSVSTRLAPGTQPSDYIAPPAFGSSKQIERLHFRYGPLLVRAGTNMIMLGGNVPKPAVDGYIVGIRPNLTLPDGTVPSVNVIHLHHGVWLNFSARDATYPVLPQRFFASGEEKTWAQLPQGVRLSVPHERPVDDGLHAPQPHAAPDDGLHHRMRSTSFRRPPRSRRA